MRVHDPSVWDARRREHRMADNDVQDMVRRIQKTLPRPLSELTPDDLKNHLVDVKNNPTQYGLPGFDTPGASDVISDAGAQIGEQHTAIQKGPCSLNCATYGTPKRRPSTTTSSTGCSRSYEPRAA